MTVHRDTRGFTLIEVLIVVAIIGLLAALAAPSLLRARMSANETGAVGSLRALNSAETSYAATAGKGAFAVLLATLVTPCPASTVGFISPDMATDPTFKSGYRISLFASAVSSPGPLDCNGTGTRTAYYSTAVPVMGGTSGLQAFATTGGGTIFFDRTGVAPTEAQMAPGGGGSPLQ
jgi:prepilin-type N-terminal cleavage/methylation domain-containing protein